MLVEFLRASDGGAEPTTLMTDHDLFVLLDILRSHTRPTEFADDVMLLAHVVALGVQAEHARSWRGWTTRNMSGGHQGRTG